MSYSRMHWGGSDVYVFESVNQGGSLECCGCSLAGGDDQWNWKDPGEFLSHLREHELKGDFVPPGVARRIWEDWRDGEFSEWCDTWHADYPEPEKPHEEVMLWWRRKVIKHMMHDKPEVMRSLLDQVENGSHHAPDPPDDPPEVSRD
jgi:hypothetical protein